MTLPLTLSIPLLELVQYAGLYARHMRPDQAKLMRRLMRMAAFGTMVGWYESQKPIDDKPHATANEA